MKTYYRKLVRDKIPEIIVSEGRTAKTYTVSESHLLEHLAKKLREESVEFAKTKDPRELADIMETLYAILDNLGIAPEEIEFVRKQKLSTHGGFKKGLVLEWVDDTAEDHIDP